MSQHQRAIELSLESNLRRIGGPYRSVERFLRTCGPLTTKKQYSNAIQLYLRWLREEKGVTMDPDELMLDNLRCIFESTATDVMTKRKHTDLLDEYVNGYLLDKKGASEASRGVKAAAIKGLYRVNDSLLFGHFSLTKQAPVAPDKPLLAEDVRQVLKTLPAHARAPLLCVWQGGIEINRVLSMRWKDVEEGLQRGENPLRVEFFGRKRHRRPYHTYFGRDAIEHLRMIRGRWRELHGREPTGGDLIFTGKTRLHVTQQQYDHLNMQFRRVAMGLHERGLVRNGHPESWHTHNLRHSFRTEAAHAGVKSEICEFLLGHIGGIAFVYNHRDEVHPEDLVKEYLKIEPHVSLDYNETIARQDAQKNERAMMSLIVDLQRQVAEMKQQQNSPQSNHAGPAIFPSPVTHASQDPR